MGGVTGLVLDVGITVCFELDDVIDSDIKIESAGTLVDESNPAKLGKIESVKDGGVDSWVVDEIKLPNGPEKLDNTEEESVFLGDDDSGYPLPRKKALDVLWWYVATFGVWNSDRGSVGSALDWSIVVERPVVCQTCLLTGKILYDIETDPSATVIAAEDIERTIVEFWQTPKEVRWRPYYLSEPSLTFHSSGSDEMRCAL